MLTTKKLFLTFLLFGLITFSYAKGNLFEFSISPVYKLKNGTINERTNELKVSSNASATTLTKNLEDLKITDLLKLSTVPYSVNTWDLKNINNVGLNAFASIGPMAIDATATVGFPQKTGSMTSIKYNSSDEGEYLRKILYSNEQLKTYFWDIKLVGKFDILNFVIFRPYLGFSYNYLNLAANNAKGYYYDSNTKIVLPNENSWANNYSREDLFAYAGLKAGVNLFNFVSITGFFDAGIFNYACSKSAYQMDFNHYYQDKMFGFFRQFNFGVNAEVKLTSILYLGADFEYSILNTIKGLDYEAANEDAKYNASNKYLGSSDGKWWTAGAYLKIRFAL